MTIATFKFSVSQKNLTPFNTGRERRMFFLPCQACPAIVISSVAVIGPRGLTFE